MPMQWSQSKLKGLNGRRGGFPGYSPPPDVGLAPLSKNLEHTHARTQPSDDGGGVVFLRLWTFSRALFSSLLLPPHPFPLPSIAFTSHPLLPSLLSFFPRGRHNFWMKLIPQKQKTGGMWLLKGDNCMILNSIRCVVCTLAIGT